MWLWGQRGVSCSPSWNILTGRELRFGRVRNGGCEMLDKPQTQVVLLGAGNTNLQVVKWWGMETPGAATLTLVSESYDMPYSGMLPGCIAGRYSRDEVTIDLSRLCAASGVSFIRASAQRPGSIHPRCSVSFFL